MQCPSDHFLFGLQLFLFLPKTKPFLMMFTLLLCTNEVEVRSIAATVFLQSLICLIVYRESDEPTQRNRVQRPFRHRILFGFPFITYCFGQII